jgi:hypothetical protein
VASATNGDNLALIHNQLETLTRVGASSTPPSQAGGLRSDSRPTGLPSGPRIGPPSGPRVGLPSGPRVGLRSVPGPDCRRVPGPDGSRQ